MPNQNKFWKFPFNFYAQNKFSNILRFAIFLILFSWMQNKHNWIFIIGVIRNPLGSQSCGKEAETKFFLLSEFYHHRPKLNYIRFFARFNQKKFFMTFKWFFFDQWAKNLLSWRLLGQHAEMAKRGEGDWTKRRILEVFGLALFLVYIYIKCLEFLFFIF